MNPTAKYINLMSGEENIFRITTDRKTERDTMMSPFGHPIWP